MDRPLASLITLPTEILTQILSHLIPMDQTFRLKTRRTRVPKSAVRGRITLRPEVYWYSWTTKQHSTWHAGKPVVCPEMLSILLIHPTIYPLALSTLYANNTLWFPDPHTLQHFTRHFSALAKSAIQTLAVNACGEPLGFHGGTTSETWFELEADTSLSDTISHFPNLHDLRLGGVGPGLVDRVQWSDTETRRMSRRGPAGTTRMVTLPPGPVGVMSHEDDEYWALDGISLVARITGPTTGDDRPLARARVFCHKLEPRVATSPMGRTIRYNAFNQEGVHRHFGTRIVSPDVLVQLGPYEMEVRDVEKALREAEVEDDRKREWDRRVAAGEFKDLFGGV